MTDYLLACLSEDINKSIRILYAAGYETIDEMSIIDILQEADKLT